MDQEKKSTKKSAKDQKIKLIMSKLRQPRTIEYLTQLVKEKDHSTTRALIARIRKHTPVFAYSNGDGYKYPDKKQIEILIKFEQKIIKNHQKNLEVLLDRKSKMRSK